MLQTYLGVLLALVAVLALVGIAGRWARRVSAGGLLGREGTALPLTVLRRVPLGPRQGVALLRVGERILLVTVGDGGVHRLLQLEEDEAAHVLAETQAAGPASFASVLASAQKALGRRGAPALLLACARRVLEQRFADPPTLAELA